MKIKELKELSTDELQAKELELRDQLFKLRFQKSLGQLENPMKVRNIRKDIAPDQDTFESIDQRDGIENGRHRKKTQDNEAGNRPSARRCRRPRRSWWNDRSGTRCIRRRSRGGRPFLVHDETDSCKIGDIVRIVETRPISKRKRWRIVEVVRKAGAEATPIENGEPQ